LHIPQSLKSIDFDDFEPDLIRSEPARGVRRLISDSLFAVDRWDCDKAETLKFETGKTHILAVLAGEVRVSGGGTELSLPPGQFCLLPASLGETKVFGGAGTRFLRIEPGRAAV